MLSPFANDSSPSQRWQRATIASLTGETPFGLWLPRPVITRTSPALLTWRSRSHASTRKRASAAVGRDSRRLRMFFRPNAASSRALRTG